MVSSCDMKGFIACTLAFAPVAETAKRDIHFSFTFDEELCLILSY